ncbi:MAG: hypothetical protein AABZ06_02245 [Bdellovibrionota bacterium]
MLTKKLNPILSLVTISSISLLTSCSAVKNMDSVKENTEKMGGTTEKMAATTDKMADTTEKMAQTTETMATTTEHMSQVTDGMAENTERLAEDTRKTREMISFGTDAARQKETADMRKKALKTLAESKSQEAKIAAAAEYHYSLEFQFWGKVKDDTPERLQQLYTESIEQYFRDMSEFLNGDPDELSTSARSKDNAQMSLYALAVTMHKVNSLAVPHARDGKMISMLDLVKEGLLINNQINNGLIEESMSPSYVQKLLVNKSKAIHLLRLRSNFLPTMVLAKISNIQKKGLKGIITRLGMRLWSWKLDTTKLDLLQILEYTEWLKAANSARDYLGKELKIDSKIDKSIMHIYENMEFIPEDSAPKDKTTPEQRKAQALRNNALRSLTLEINKLSIKR